MRAEPCHEGVAQGRGRGQHARALGESGAVERQAQRALAEHDGGAVVAGILVRGDRGAIPRPGRGRGGDLHPEASGGTLLGGGPLTRPGQDPVQHPARRGPAQSPLQCTKSDVHAHRQQGGQGARPEVGHLPVAEGSAVGPVRQGVGQPHHPGVVVGHHEAAQPVPRLGVALGPGPPAQPAEASRACLGPWSGFIRLARAERVRGAQDAPQAGVGLQRDRLLAGGVDGSTRDAPPHRPHDEGGVRQGALTVRGCPIGREQDAEVGGDRVEAAGVDDPGAGLPGPGVHRFEGPPDEQQFPGQVGVVGAFLRARRHDVSPVTRVGPDRGGEHGGPRREAPQAHGVRRVDLDQRPVPARLAEAGPHLGQTLRATPGQRDPGPGTARGCEVLRGQGPDEPGGSEQDDVERALSHDLTVPRAARVRGAVPRGRGCRPSAADGRRTAPVRCRPPRSPRRAGGARSGSPAGRSRRAARPPTPSGPGRG